MKLSEIQEQLRAQGIEVGEDAIADKLKVLDIKEKDITSDIQELVIQDLAQAFQDEQKSSAIAPRKRTQKQAIAEVREWFAQFGLNYTEAEVKTRLQDHNINAADVTIEWVQDWAVQIKRSAIAPLENAPPAPSTPVSQQDVIDIDPQVQEAIAAGASGLQSEVIDYIDQNEQQLASITSMLVQYNRGLKVRLWTGVAEGIQSEPDLGLDINATVKQRWDTLNQNLRSKIDQVNAMAGVKDAAA